jgi:hypothetical protein
MPYPSAKVASDIISSGSSFGVAGSEFPKLAMAIAQTCEVQFMLPSTHTATVSGLVGSGMCQGVTSPFGVFPQTLGLKIYSSMVSNGMSGSNLMQLCMAISTGICTNITSLLVMGISVGVGTGVGIAKSVYFDQFSFFSTLSSFMTTNGIVGSESKKMAMAIAEGVCSTMSSSLTSTVSVTGPAGTVPAATVLMAKLV